MDISMKEIKDTPKYLLIKNAIRDRILLGEFDDKLPGDRVLAREFGFSYMTVRKAIDALVEEDVLFRLPAKGTFVNKGGLSGKKTYNIGFFLEPRIKGGISSPYYSLIFKMMEEILKKEGYSLFFFTDLESIDPLKGQKKYDGLILSCFPAIEKKIATLVQLSPAVIIDNRCHPCNFPYVGIDNRQGVYDAVEYLLRIGHRNIGFVSGIMDSAVGTDRLEGFRSALEDAGIKFSPKMVFGGDYDYRSGQEAVKKFLSLKDSPTAIVCANDSMAFGVIEGARRMGKEIPADLSVIGFDDIEFAAQSSPALTTVKAPIKEIVHCAVDLLLTCLREGTVKENETLFPARLVVRDTCRAL